MILPDIFWHICIRQDLHVAGKHDQFGAGLLDDVHDLGFGLRLVLLGHLDVVEGDVVVDHDLLVFEMVGDDADDIDRQRADLPAVEQVVEAMAEARHHQQHLHAVLASWISASMANCLATGSKPSFSVGKRRTFLGDEGDAHEEHAGIEIVELRTVDDVAALVGQITRNRRDDAAGRLQDTVST